MTMESEVEALKQLIRHCNHYGAGHIVFADQNLEDHHIKWCLERENDPTAMDHEVLTEEDEGALKRLLALPLADRYAVFDMTPPSSESNDEYACSN